MYKALISFSGKISMTMGEVREISDSAIVKDLLKAGYIEEIKNEKKTAEKNDTQEEKPVKKTVKKKTEK